MIRGRNTLQEFASDHSERLNQASQWKKLLREGANDLFTRRKTTQAEDESQTMEAELFQPYCFAEA